MPTVLGTASLVVSFLLTTAFPLVAGEPLWVQIAQLYGSDTASNDRFGETLALEGDTLVVGAWRKDGETGAVYVFERRPEAPTEWLETVKLTPVPGDKDFGISVALDGDTLAVIALPSDGRSISIHGRDTGGEGQWGLAARYEVENASSIAVDGDALVVGNIWADVDGKSDAGAVYVLGKRPGGPADWHFVTTLTASDGLAQDHFGDTLALDGDRLLIGAPNARDFGVDSGAAYIFERDEAGSWTEVVKLLRSDGEPHDDFGQAVDLDAETAIVGSDADLERDAALIFEREPGGVWQETQELIGSDTGPSDRFGSRTAVSGDVAAVGAWGYDLPYGDAGAVYIFERHHGGGGAWGEITKIQPPDLEFLDNFGRAMALDRNTLLVAAHADDDRGFEAGTVYLLSRTEPLLAVTGSCPGELEVSLIGATPGGRAVLLGAQGEGVTPIPLGPCAGTEVHLAAPKVVFTGTATSGGDLVLKPVVGPGLCGRYLQAVDVESCVTAAVVQVP